MAVSGIIFITFVPFPFQKEKKLPFYNIYPTADFKVILSTEAYIIILILSIGAVKLLETAPDIPPEIKVIKIEGSPIKGY